MPSTKRSRVIAHTESTQKESTEQATITSRSAVYITSRPILSVSTPNSAPPTNMPTRAAAPIRLTSAVDSPRSGRIPIRATPTMLRM